MRGAGDQPQVNAGAARFDPGDTRMTSKEIVSMEPDDLVALDFEYKLTVAYRLSNGCECPSYFVRRREVLLPEVIKVAEARDIDVVDLFAAYARGVHKRHLDGLSLETGAAA